MDIQVKRIYDTPSANDGLRVLVDKLWPRGLSKEAAHIDEWFKSIAPSNELRKWFNHDPEKWEVFKNRYTQELKEQAEDVKLLFQKIKDRPKVTLLYSTREMTYNHAVFLKDYFEKFKALP